MGWPDGLLGLVLFGPARPENQLTCRAWVVRQARWPRKARPWRHDGPYGPMPYQAVLSMGPCHAEPGQPVLHFTYTSQDKILNTRQHYPAS